MNTTQESPRTKPKTRLRVGFVVLLLVLVAIANIGFFYYRRMVWFDAASPVAGTLFVSVQTAAGRDTESAVGGLFRIPAKWASAERLSDQMANDLRVDPSGKRIAYCLGRSLFVRSADGEQRKLRELPAGSNSWGRPAWSPDGAWIACSSTKVDLGGMHERENWKFAADGSSAEKLNLPETETLYDWSPDGHWFATVSDRDPQNSRKYQIYLISTDGETERQVTNAGLNFAPRFSPDGKQLYFSRVEKGESMLCSVDVDSFEEGATDGAAVRVVCRLGSDPIHAYALSPDGQSAALISIKAGIAAGPLPARLELLKLADGLREPVDVKHAIWIGSVDWR